MNDALLFGSFVVNIASFPSYFGHIFVNCFAVCLFTHNYKTPLRVPLLQTSGWKTLPTSRLTATSRWPSCMSLRSCVPAVAGPMWDHSWTAVRAFQNQSESHWHNRSLPIDIRLRRQKPTV